uniref:Putative ribonuclease H-like domain-containing protein n=1 Tax=Tanacetum cinerariifolium TaxID=118510 RepID=A0A6L2MNU6_TANCI|nr:putative ribonuclease H-like domain-containing protein [Tanacetum cinerariifolium]
MDEFYSRKGIKREFSNARTPQQNGVAERRNTTLIEAARTMVLVTKPHNKTPYELFNERSPAIGFLRPFGYHVKILNTLDHLGKFDAKGDEEHLLLTFQAAKKDDAIPNNNLTQKEQQEVNRDKEVLKSSRNSNPTASSKVSTNDSFKLASGSTMETEVPTVSSSVRTDSLYVPLVTASVPRIISKGVSSFLEPLSLGNVMSFENRLEDFFGDTSNAVSLNEVEDDLSNMEIAIQVSPTPTLGIYKDHPKSQIIGPVDTPVQTRQKTKDVDEQSFIATIHQKTNPDLLSIEPIRLFQAYASYMGFTVYQMDVKSAFLYGTIDEEEKDGTGKDVELHLYRSIFGSLMYLTTSRPDIMFAICACARHQVTPKECHLHVVKRIFRYLKGNHKLGLWYPKESPFDLVAYLDGNYGGANKDRKSTTRGFQFLGRRLISWQCKKQTIMATSTTEAEYVAGASGCGQVLWMQNQLLDYGDCYEKKLTNVDHIHTDDNVVDLLTKAFDVGVETTDGEKKILAQVSGMQRTISESSIRRHLKLNNKEAQDKSIHHEQITQSPQHAQITSPEPIPQSHEQTTSQVPLPGADETSFLTRDVRYEEAFPTKSSLDVGQDRENINKTFAMPYEALPIVTSLGGGEGNLEITQLKTRVKTLKDKEKRREGFAQEDTPNTRGVDQGEDLLDRDKSAHKECDNTDEMPLVLGSLGAVYIQASGGLRSVFTTASLSDATASIDISPAVATANGSFPTAAIFTTTSVATPTSKLARDLESKFAQKDQIIREPAERDSKIARIHAEKELEMMVAELDRSIEMIAKYLSEYEQAGVGLSHDEKRSNAGWKAKDIKGMTFEQIEEKFILVWEKMRDFVPMNSTLESERLKREDLDNLWSLVKENCSTTKVIDEKAKELWVELKRLYEPDSRDPLWALQRLSVPTADVYIAKKLATVEDFVVLHEDKIYTESKTHELNMRQHRWLELLSDYDYEIRYHPGKENVVADSLSRKYRIKPLRVRALVMTIGLELPKEILNAQADYVLANMEAKPPICWTFKVLEKVGSVSYKLEILQELSRVHNVFHVSNLKKCHADEPLAVPFDGLHFDDKL